MPTAACLLAAAVLLPAANPAVPPELADYVRKPDPSFAWKRAGKTDTPVGTVHELRLISQTWHGEAWEHALHVFVPTGVKPKPTLLLYNTGGDPSPTTGLLGLLIAQKVGAPIAFLYNVPKQPLYGGKREDALIAETFVRYLGDRDPTWPLLFPMAKSVVRGMDALQAYFKDEWQTEVTKFVVTGASKRGWTSWLTAAGGDPRVSAIAPMVFDALRFPEQMANQVRAFGKPSEMIRDYTARGLIPIPDTPAGQSLWKMVDPWSYRAKVTVPKLILNGTNDPYWPLDALNSYWDDLNGDKYVLYVPNAGHGLEQVRDSGAKDRDRALGTLAAFARAQVFGEPLPKLTWKHEDADGAARLTLTSDKPLKAARVWTADAPTRDFRKARWTATELKPDGGTATATADRPGEGFRAFFAEAEYDGGGGRFHLSTQIRVLAAK